MYAPWCQFCQAAETAFEEFAAGGAKAAAYRGDTDRDFVMSAEEAKDYGIIDEVISVRELADTSGPITAIR